MFYFFPTQASFVCYICTVQISDIREAGPGSAPIDSAFSNDEGFENQTGNDVASLILSGDSGKPNSPEGSTPFSMVPTDVSQASSPDDVNNDSDGELPPWLENVNLSFKMFCQYL